MRKIRIFEKLLVSLIAAFCLFVFTTAPFVNAATIYTERFFQYTVENQSITIVRYFGAEETVKIPAAIGGLPVNTIAAGAFAEKTPVKDVWLPDTITTVETNAFPKGVAVHYAEEEPANGSFPPDDTSTTNGSQNVEETYSGKTDTSKNGQDTSKDSSEEQRIDSNNPTDGNGARPTKEPNDESAKGNTGTKPSPTSVAKDVPNGLEEGEGSIEKDENSSGKGSSSDKNGGSSKPTSIDDSSVSIGKNSSGDGSAGKGDKNSSILWLFILRR